MSRPALDQLLAAADAALEHAVGDAVPADYDALSLLLDVPIERLGRAWSAVTHLNEVADTPGAARGLPRRPAAGHRLLHPAGRRRARCTRKYRQIAASPGRRR